MEQQRGIIEYRVPLDAAAQASLDRFLSFNPSADQIRALINAPQHRCYYDERTKMASYATVSGRTVICFMVPELTAEQARDIESRLDDSGWMSGPELAGIVKKVTGKELRPMPYA